MYALAITAPCKYKSRRNRTSYSPLVWWYTSTVAAVILALNRCLGIVSRDWSDKLFGGRRAWLWVLVAVAYGIHHDIYTKACIFSGVIGCWYFNPHVGYLEDVDHNVSVRWSFLTVGIFQYSAQDLLQHNIVVLVSLTTLYGVFVLRIAWSKQQVEGEWQGQVNVKAVGAFVIEHSFLMLATGYTNETYGESFVNVGKKFALRHLAWGIFG